MRENIKVKKVRETERIEQMRKEGKRKVMERINKRIKKNEKY